jgi:hypothetical protein
MIIKKFTNNLLTIRAVNVLGIKTYFRYVFYFISSILSIFEFKDLRPLDKKMGKKHVENFIYNGNKFKFDCHYCDQKIKDGTYAFGVVREIYIRDCYFKYLPKDIYKNINNAVDIGANRGAFSSLMTSTAKFILSVEAQKEFKPIIENNLKRNKHSNYSLEIGFVGYGGELANHNIQLFTIEDLLDKNNIEQVDLIKMDIEGSEFALFDEPSWLLRVNAICMEVHPEYGNPKKILKVLKKYDFEFKVADENLILLDNPDFASFIYAWR